MTLTKLSTGGTRASWLTEALYVHWSSSMREPCRLYAQLTDVANITEHDF